MTRVQHRMDMVLKNALGLWEKLTMSASREKQ